MLPYTRRGKGSPGPGFKLLRVNQLALGGTIKQLEGARDYTIDKVTLLTGQLNAPGTLILLLALACDSALHFTWKTFLYSSGPHLRPPCTYGICIYTVSVVNRNSTRFFYW